MPGSRRAKACTGCRQVKLACDAPVRTPCTRCRDRNLECRFDSNFKRISTRGIVRDMTTEFNNLRASTENLSPPSINESSSQSPLPNGSPRNNSFSSASRQSPGENVVDVPWLQAEPSQDQTTFVSGNVSVSREVATDVFTHFEKFNYQHAPFLETVSSLGSLFERSPLLFWTIALVSSQSHPRHSSLYEQIYTIQHELLSNTIHGAVQNIENVHALLLLCLWPVPNITGSTDPWWNHIGLAVTAAQQLLCHKPLPRDSPMTDYTFLVNPAARGLNGITQSITWVGCFDVSTEVSTFYGFPPEFSTPRQFASIEKAKERASTRISAIYAAKLEIKQVVCMYQSQLDVGDDPSAFFTQAIMFDRSLEQIKVTYQPHWNSDLEITLDGAKLYLYAFTFLCSTPSSTTPVLRSSAQHYLILQKAWAAASRFISNMTDLSISSNPNVRHHAGLLGFYPKHYFTKLFFAAVFLFRILVSSHGQAILSHDRSAMISSLQAAHKIFQSFASHHREHTRAAINIELLVKILRERPMGGAAAKVAHHSSSPTRSRLETLILDNRLSASIMWDAIFRAGEERNAGAHDNDNTVPVAFWKTMTEQFQHRLPSVPTRPSGPMSASFQPSANEALKVRNQASMSQNVSSMPSMSSIGSRMLPPTSTAGQSSSSQVAMSANLQQLGGMNTTGRNPQGIPDWWTSWDSYMEDFGIGMENFPEEQSNGFVQFG